MRNLISEMQIITAHRSTSLLQTCHCIPKLESWLIFWTSLCISSARLEVSKMRPKGWIQLMEAHDPACGLRLIPCTACGMCWPWTCVLHVVCRADSGHMQCLCTHSGIELGPQTVPAHQSPALSLRTRASTQDQSRAGATCSAHAWSSPALAQVWGLHCT